MAVTAFTEAQHPMDGLLEALHQLSIDEVIIAQSQTILVGMLLGTIGVVANMTLTGAVGGHNVGTSTIGSITGTTQSQNGVYSIVLLSATEFEVQRPDGTVDGAGAIGAAYTVGTVNFTITTGGTPTVGDLFTITVTRPFDEGGEQYEAWNPTATDGSQIAVGIALYPAVTASGQTARITALRRDGEFRLSAVNFASGATAAQKAFAQQQLAAKNIILR